MSKTPPGLQYPKLPADLHPDVASAMRNIFDNLFYVRGRADVPAGSLDSKNQRTPKPVLVGTHNNRLTAFSAASQPVGNLFYETNRHVTYIIIDQPHRWQFMSGCMVAGTSSQPNDLNTADTGFEFYDTDLDTFQVWIGLEWKTV